AAARPQGVCSASAGRPRGDFAEQLCRRPRWDISDIQHCGSGGRVGKAIRTPMAALLVVVMALSPGAASAAVGGSPVASAVPVTAPEVVEDNPHGDHSGGFASALPTDSATLRAALER